MIISSQDTKMAIGGYGPVKIGQYHYERTKYSLYYGIQKNQMAFKQRTTCC